MTSDQTTIGSTTGEHSGLSKVYQSVDKSVVIQDIRVFNETPISSKKCIKTLAKILYYFYGCEGLISYPSASTASSSEHVKLSTMEGIDLFFTLTKIFQSKKVYLKRLVFILLKELASVSSDTIIATSSLIHEFNSSQSATLDKHEAFYKAAALRVLSCVMQPSMLQSNERIIRQAILDKNSCISSAGLIASYFAWGEGKEIVRRWSNEITEKLSSISISQYHALGLMYLIKSNDRISLVKLLHGILKNSLSSSSNPAALMLALRYFAVLIQEGGYSVQRELASIDICHFLKFKGRMEMIAFEAAKVIYQLDLTDSASPEMLSMAVRTLGSYLSTSHGKAVHRFAAIRLLNLFSFKNALLVAKFCNSDIEGLITDSNRSIATYAVTTLLKTGTEESVDRLINQIGSFFGDISDEFKIIVVEAIQSLCTKFPLKQPVMIDFLLKILRQEGGQLFKQAGVECILQLLANNPLIKEHVISSLAEYIEDCEFSSITIQILHLLGNETYSLQKPSRFIRIIYNRLLLDGPLVRIAATSALFRIGMLSRSEIPLSSLGKLASAESKDLSLCSQVKSILLHTTETDEDDEVRETALLYLGILENVTSSSSFVPTTISKSSDLTLPLEEMEESLMKFISSNESTFPFEIESLSLTSKEEFPSTESALESFQQDTSSKEAEEISESKEKISLLEQYSSLGTRLSKSPSSLWLTEKETEYVVSCFKHIFSNAIVFEFCVKNTLEDVSLMDVSMEMSHLDETMEELMSPVFATHIARLNPGEEDSFFIAYSYNNSSGSLPIGASFSCVMVFYSKPYDESDNNSAISLECTRDEYQVEDVDIQFGDFVTFYSNSPISLSEVEHIWDEMQITGYENEDSISLDNASSIQQAIDYLLQLIGNYPIGGTERIYSSSSIVKSHQLVVGISDCFNFEEKAIAKFTLIQSQSNTGGILCEVVVRSTSEEFSSKVLRCFS